MIYITLCSYCEQPVYPSQKFCGACGNEVALQGMPVEPVVRNGTDQLENYRSNGFGETFRRKR